MTTTPRKYLSQTRLAHAAGVSRTVISRLLAQSVLRPDAFVEIAGRTLPIFDPSHVTVILRNTLPSKHS